MGLLLFSEFGKCNHNKSPGLDGLCYEFYQETFSIIKNEFLQVLQCQLDTLLNGIISLHKFTIKASYKQFL